MEVFLAIIGSAFVVDSSLFIYYVAKDVIPNSKINKAHQEQEKLRIEAGKTKDEWYGTINNVSQNSNN